MINSVRKVALESPATKAVVIDAHSMERLGIPSAIGINPSIVVTVVMMTGRLSRYAANTGGFKNIYPAP